MDLLKIKQLIDVLAASDLAEIELVEGNHRVRLVRRLAAPLAVPHGGGAAAAPQTNSVAQLVSAPVVSADATIVPVTAPLYGVVHLTPAPDAPVFVHAGDIVQAGQTVCVIEAMKMFHEVRVAQSARIAAVLVAAGDEVDAGTPLFRLEAVEADV